MRMAINLTIYFSMLITPNALSAAEWSDALNDDYSTSKKFECEVVSVTSSNERGAPQINSEFNSGFVGSKFVVDADTGHIYGETLTTVLATTARVINAGGSGFSFGAISEYETGEVSVIKIDEWCLNESWCDSAGERVAFEAWGAPGFLTGLCSVSATTEKNATNRFPAIQL